MAELTASEQFMLELINRARLDPVGEAARYGIDLNQGLTTGTISTTPKQVLAPNQYLADSADSHSTWMLNINSPAPGPGEKTLHGQVQRALTAPPLPPWHSSI
jgi:hypothetical protein